MLRENISDNVKEANKYVPIIALTGTILIACFRTCSYMCSLGYLQVLGVDSCYIDAVDGREKLILSIITTVAFILGCILSYCSVKILFYFKKVLKCWKIVVIAVILLHGVLAIAFLYFSLTFMIPFRTSEFLEALGLYEIIYVVLFSMEFASVGVAFGLPDIECKGKKEINDNKVKEISNTIINVVLKYPLRVSVVMLTIIALLILAGIKELGEDMARNNREYKIVVGEASNDTEHKKEGKKQLVLFEGEDIYILSDYREADNNSEKKTIQIFNSRQVVVDKKEIETVMKEYDDVILEPDDNLHSESGEIDQN